MTKKQKKDFYEAFADAFNDVVMPSLNNLVTNDDLKKEIKAVRDEMATKEDLKREVGFIRSDIQDLRAEISTMPTRKEFNILKRKITVN